MQVQAERFHLNGHIIGYGSHTQKVESPYKHQQALWQWKG